MNTQESAQELQRVLQYLKRRPLVYNAVVTMTHDLLQSTNILERSNIIHESATLQGLRGGVQDSPQSSQRQRPSDIFSAPTTDLCEWIPTINTHHDPHLDSAALESILPSIQNPHAKFLLTSLMLQVRSEANQENADTV